MISTIILTKDCEDVLSKCLDALTWIDEVVILDNGSTDETLVIAAGYENVVIHHSPFIGFGPLRNLATKLASHDWILSIDSDEILEDTSKDKIRSNLLQDDYVYSLTRKNCFIGKRILGCGWGAEHIVRLFNRKNTTYSNAMVHESVCTDGLKIIPLNVTIEHHSYRKIEDLLDKMQNYSTLFAEEQLGVKKGSLGRALFHGFGAFVKTYLLKRGFVDGKEGFVIAKYNADTAFYKYLKLSYLHLAKHSEAQKTRLNTNFVPGDY